MKKRIKKTDVEIFRSIRELNNESEWTEGELDAYLRDEGVDPSQVVQQVRAIVNNALSESRGFEASASLSYQQAVPITSLIEEGNARGLTTVQVAKAVGLSLRLLAKLDSGLLLYASIPLEKLADIGNVIGRTVEDVSNYLRHARPNVQGAHFKADSAPVASMQQDFFEAVAEDDSLEGFLTPEQLAGLRALQAKYKGRSPSSDQAVGEEDLTNLPPPSASLRAEVREIADEFADAFEEMKRRGD
jgi:hypothetical protein